MPGALRAGTGRESNGEKGPELRRHILVTGTASPAWSATHHALGHARDEASNFAGAARTVARACLVGARRRLSRRERTEREEKTVRVSTLFRLRSTAAVNLNQTDVREPATEYYPLDRGTRSVNACLRIVFT